jgi:hypothetical protein
VQHRQLRLYFACSSTSLTETRQAADFRDSTPLTAHQIIAAVIWHKKPLHIRHDIAAIMAENKTEQTPKGERERAKKKPTETPEQARAKGWKHWLRYCDKYGYTVAGNKV